MNGTQPGFAKEVQDYKALVSISAIRLAVSAGWPLWKFGYYLPIETERQRPYPQVMARTDSKFFDSLEFSFFFFFF